MAVIFPYEGRKLACERITGRKDNGFNTNAGRLCLRLFQNNLTPDASTDYDDFTEANFPGYAAIRLETSLWRAAAADGNGQAYTVLTQPQWFRHSGASGSNTIYGWYLTTDPDLGEDKVLCCERLSASQSFSSSASELPVGILISTANLGSSATILNEGKPRILDRLFGKVASRANLGLRWFKKAPTLASTLTLADFEIATFSGYADQSIPYDGWPAAVINVANRGQITHTAVNTLSHSGGDIANTLYGYVCHESGLALWCERFTQPKTISAENPFEFLQARFEIGVAA